jgi:ubiquinone/menaquinone biosynthesis C-methylase UbiE
MSVSTHVRAASTAAAPRRKPYLGIQMEGPIARWYAHLTGRDARHRETARTIATYLEPGSTVLEVAPGPGYMAIELAKLGDYRISGLDISRSFVHIAQANAQRAGVKNVEFKHGDVAHMSLPDNTFDFIVCQAAFKNFPDPVAALNEMQRVLKPGGQALILDLRKDAPKDAIDREIKGMHLSPLNAVLTRWVFRFGLLRTAYTQAALESVVKRSRFGTGELQQPGIGFELRLTK